MVMSMKIFENKKLLIQKGFTAFEARRYDKSMQYFGDALRIDPQNLEAKIGLLLSDMAQEFPHETNGFYDLYQSMIESNPRRSRKQIQKSLLKSIESFDHSLHKIAQIIDENDKSEQLNGILYRDFLEFVKAQGFVRAFENLIFSTKIIFTRRSDFYEFLHALVDNGLKDHALQYIESMKEPHISQEIAQILKKIK